MEKLSKYYWRDIETCPVCGKKFVCLSKHQVGFRKMKYMICPYCGESLKYSRDFDYHCEPLTKD